MAPYWYTYCLTVCTGSPYPGVETQSPILSPLATLRPGGVGGSQQWILKWGSEHSTWEVGEEGGHPVPAGLGCICTLPHLQEAP